MNLAAIATLSSLFRFPSCSNPFGRLSGFQAFDERTGNVRALHFIRPQRAWLGKIEHVGNIGHVLDFPFSPRPSIGFNRGSRLFNALGDMSRFSVMHRHWHSPYNRRPQER